MAGANYGVDLSNCGAAIKNAAITMSMWRPFLAARSYGAFCRGLPTLVSISVSDRFPPLLPISHPLYGSERDLRSLAGCTWLANPSPGPDDGECRYPSGPPVPRLEGRVSRPGT